jgi:hypothetical protein
VETPEVQILAQLLGIDQARMIVALNTMASSCAQMGQQIQGMQQAAAAQTQAIGAQGEQPAAVEAQSAPEGGTG